MNYKTGSPIILFMILVLASVFPASVPPVAHSSAPTPITSLPYVINEPGVYMLESDLSTLSDGIIVNTSDVIVLGNGHRITGAGSGIGVNITSPEGNITIRDLAVTGFDVGVKAYNVQSPGGHLAFTDLVLEGLLISGVGTGINLTGLYDYGGFIISRVRVTGFTDYGLYLKWNGGGVVADSVFEGSNASDTGIYVQESEGLYIYNTTVRGVGLVGMHFYQAYYFSIVASKVVESGYGLYTHTSYYYTLMHDTFSGNRFGNVYIINSGRYAITSNNISHAGGPGIFINETHESRISSNYIAYNDGDGIRIVYYSSKLNITSNQIIRNNGYGVSADTTTSSRFNVLLNVFEQNAMSPQALDTMGVGNWSSNYWSDLSGSTYVFDDNEDATPLEDPLYDVSVSSVNLPPGNLSGKIPVEVVVENPSPADAHDVALTIAWSEPPGWRQIPFTWIEVDPATASTASSGSVITDYGDYILEDYDDGYIVYKLPTPVQVYGETYTYISASTNGYVELLTDNQSRLLGEYSVHLYGYHRVVPNPEDPYGVTTIFAYSGDLYAVNYLGIFNVDGMIVVAFNGSTYSDEDPVNYPVNYEVIIHTNGTITITLGNITLGELDGDGFTGLYHRTTGIEIEAGYMLPPQTSYQITPSLHQANTTNITVPANTTITTTLTWDTTLLPHYSPYTLWTTLSQTPTETNTINNIHTPITINILPPPIPTTIGGKLEQDNTNKPTTILLAILTTSLLIILKLTKNKL